ncbi:MAG: hypothetical protein KGQ52_10905 [Alphaproteobacteria bacterium]|nr:hypothetical protein [Alphaproteobacteria bacterium]
MSGFEFFFSLVGLLLGLALAEGLGGLSRAVKASHRVRIGWPTALLGIFVSCDVVSFWMYGWALRDKLPISWPMMFGGFLLTGVYYVCASLIFPDDDLADLDAHFARNHRKVLAGVMACNAALIGVTLSLFPDYPILNLNGLLFTWSFFPLALLAILARNQRIKIACLLLLIATYPASALSA